MQALTVTNIHLTCSNFYTYKGWTFEWKKGRPVGPWPCKKDLELRKRAGRKFWNMFEEFFNLSDEEQEHYRVL